MRSPDEPTLSANSQGAAKLEEFASIPSVRLWQLWELHFVCVCFGETHESGQKKGYDWSSPR